MGKEMTLTQWLERETIQGEERRISKAEIRQRALPLASELADRANTEADSSKWLYREIISRGGIRRHRSEWEPQEEYTVNIPVWYRRKDGLPPDEMADELGMSESDLYEAVAAAERTRVSIRGSLSAGVKQWRQKDFIEEAYAILEDELMEVSLEDIPF